jgi:hypothetical protein
VLNRYVEADHGGCLRWRRGSGVKKQVWCLEQDDQMNGLDGRGDISCVANKTPPRLAPDRMKRLDLAGFHLPFARSR